MPKYVNICNICDLSFKFQANLIVHKKLKHFRHLDQSVVMLALQPTYATTCLTYKCHNCKFKARHMLTLKNHEFLHGLEARFSCGKCPERFVHVRDLEDHVLKLHCDGMSCKICNKGFSTAKAVRNHFNLTRLRPPVEVDATDYDSCADDLSVLKITPSMLSLPISRPLAHENRPSEVLLPSGPGSSKDIPLMPPPGVCAKLKIRPAPDSMGTSGFSKCPPQRQCPEKGTSDLVSDTETLDLLQEAETLDFVPDTETSDLVIDLEDYEDSPGEDEPEVIICDDLPDLQQVRQVEAHLDFGGVVAQNLGTNPQGIEMYKTPSPSISPVTSRSDPESPQSDPFADIEIPMVLSSPSETESLHSPSRAKKRVHFRPDTPSELLGDLLEADSPRISPEPADTPVAVKKRISADKSVILSQEKSSGYLAGKSSKLSEGLLMNTVLTSTAKISGKSTTKSVEENSSALFDILANNLGQKPEGTAVQNSANNSTQKSANHSTQKSGNHSPRKSANHAAQKLGSPSPKNLKNITETSSALPSVRTNANSVSLHLAKSATNSGVGSSKAKTASSSTNKSANYSPIKVSTTNAVKASTSAAKMASSSAAKTANSAKYNTANPSVQNTSNSPQKTANTTPGKNVSVPQPKPASTSAQKTASTSTQKPASTSTQKTPNTSAQKKISQAQTLAERAKPSNSLEKKSASTSSGKATSSSPGKSLKALNKANISTGITLPTINLVRIDDVLSPPKCPPKSVPVDPFEFVVSQQDKDHSIPLRPLKDYREFSAATKVTNNPRKSPLLITKSPSPVLVFVLSDEEDASKSDPIANFVGGELELRSGATIMVPGTVLRKKRRRRKAKKVTMPKKTHKDPFAGITPEKPPPPPPHIIVGRATDLSKAPPSRPKLPNLVLIDAKALNTLKQNHIKRPAPCNTNGSRAALPPPKHLQMSRRDVPPIYPIKPLPPTALSLERHKSFPSQKNFPPQNNLPPQRSASPQKSLSPQNFVSPQNFILLRNSLPPKKPVESHWRKKRTHPDKKGKYPCEICKVPLDSRVELFLHEKRAHPNALWICGVCSKFFSRKRELTLHRKNHNKEYKFRCGTCYRAFTRRSALLVHRRREAHGGKVFNCPYCSRLQVAFNSRRELAKHRFAVHKKGDRIYECMNCPAKFYSGNFLTKHHLLVHCPRRLSNSKDPPLSSFLSGRRPRKGGTVIR